MKENDFLECPKNGNIEKCPICNSMQVAYHKWPESGTHVFTIPYECGTEIDYPMGHHGCSFGVKCDGTLKRFEMPEIPKVLPDETKETLYDLLKDHKCKQAN